MQEPVKVPFYRHDLGAPELEEIARVFQTPILTTGDQVAEFERQFAAWLGAKHAIGVTSWTGGAHIALLALGIKPGDEVITTPLTFIASATAILQAGATPVFVDVEPHTGNIDLARIEAAITPRTKAILPVHLYGLMCDMRGLRALADKHGLALVEDAAHCVEGIRDGVRPGELSEAAVFSFFATKNLACGEGGAVIVNSDEVAKKLQLLRLHGMDRTSSDREREGYRHWDMPIFGWKYNMDNIHAAILLPQMKRLDAKIKVREELAALYFERLAGIPGLSWPARLPNTRHANHLFPILIDPARRDDIIAHLDRSKVATVVNYRAIHLLTYFRETYGFKPGDFPIAERLGSQCISLPFFPGLREDEVDRVVTALAEILK
jgi:dTDP-4-amino-4,6-dideoxygalactose transaminase